MTIKRITLTSPSEHTKVKRITSALPTPVVIHDSDAVQNQIDATVNQTFIDQFDTHDSAAIQAMIDAELATRNFYDSDAVQAQIDSAVTQSFIDTFDTHDSAAVVGQINDVVDQTYIDAFDTHDSAAVQGQIDTTLAGDVTVGGNLTVDGYIAGPSTMTIDPATVGTDSGTLIVLGNLQVEGETTTVNSTTVSISDKNIVLADSATNASQADDAGITVNGANATIQYKAIGDKWEFNKPLFHGADRVLTIADDLHDSAAVLGQINATVNQTYIDAFDTHDSAAVVGQINDVVDQTYVRNFIDQSFIDTFDTHDSDAIAAQISAALIGAGSLDSAAVATIADERIALADTHDSAAVQGQIDTALAGFTSYDSAAVDTQIDSAVNQAFVNALGVDAITLGGNDSSYYLNYNNFTNTPTIPTLGNDYVDSAEVNLLIAAADTHDSAAIQAMIDATLAVTDTHDSDAVLGQINATVNQAFIDQFDTHDSAAIQAMINATDTHDSAAVLGQINATVNQAFIDQFDTHDSAAVLGQINATVNQAFIDQFDTHDSAAIQAMIDATDTHDSAAVVGQINLEVDKAFVDALDVDAITLGGNDSSYYLDYNNFTNTPTIPALGTDYVDSAEVNILIAAADTHDSAAVVGQINTVVNQAFIDQFDTHDSAAIQAMIDATDTHDSAAVVGQINLEVDKAFVDALGVDADTVDGIHANQFLRSDVADTIDGGLTLSNGTEFIIGTGTNPLTITYETVPQSAYFKGNNWSFADSDGDTFINAVNTGTESIVQLRHNGNTKLETSDSGLDITGDAMISGDAILTNVDASGNVAAAGTITTSDLITFEGDSATVANLTTAIVATAAMSSVQAIEATVVSVNATSGERQVSRVLLTHDTTDTYMNEYAVINTGASDEFTLDADTSGGNFRLKLDNISGNTLFAKSSITYL